MRMSSRIFARCFAWLVFSALCLAALVRADTVKLNDGTVVEGDILSENETQLVINAEFASGTITEKQTLNKSDIAQIIRLTPDQKAARDMARAYKKLQPYKLDPAYSFTVSQYDQVINGVFQPFLAQYTNSPYAAQVQSTLAEWQSERDQVASGKARYKGQWMSADAAAALTENDRLRHLSDLGQQYLAAGKFAAALEQFAAIISSAREPDLIANAKDLYNQTCHLWLDPLQQQEQALDEMIKTQEGYLDHSHERREEAENKLKHDVEAQKSSPTYLLGDAALVAKDNADFDAARADYENGVSHLNDLHDQRTALGQQIADVQAKAATYATDEEAGVVYQPPSPAPPAPPQSVKDATIAWIKKDWLFLAAGGLIGLWAFSRLFS